MADVDKHNIDQQEQSSINDNNISSLFEQIYEQLVCIIVFYYLEYPWNRKSASIRYVDILLIHILSPLGFMISLKDLLESNQFHSREST
jgi:hypothetical protein